MAIAASSDHCVAEAERKTCAPLGPRTTLEVKELDIKRPTDPGGASWFVTSATSDIFQ